MNIVIIDNYDSFTYNLFQMVQAMVSTKIKVFRNDEIDFAALKQQRPDKIILSPGPGHPVNDADFGVCKDIIVRHDEVKAPTLGVCLGHQGMVQHLGGTVVRAPEVVHGKASDIKIEISCPLFDGLPEVFSAMRYHSLVAQEEDFPEDLQIVARETKKRLIMALKHKKKPLYGVQFHPESIGTPSGNQILRNFVEKC
jgi:anthranilate synthase component 2